jgi:hypothetical protein
MDVMHEMHGDGEPPIARAVPAQSLASKPRLAEGEPTVFVLFLRVAKGALIPTRPRVPRAGRRPGRYFSA